MLSKFEDTLLRSSRFEVPFRQILFEYLYDDDGITLRSLRTVSRVLLDLVNNYSLRQAFRNVYIRDAMDAENHIQQLEKIVPYCRYLTITIGPQELTTRYSIVSHSPTRSGSSLGQLQTAWTPSRITLRRTSQELAPAASSPPLARGHISTTLSIEGQNANDVPQHAWRCVFARARDVRVLTLRVYGERGWPGTTRTERLLVMVRTALEKSPAPRLHEIRLAPVHAMGILHLRWEGCGAFRPRMASSCVWHRLETLELYLENPYATGRLTAAQRLMFTKSLYEYLRSFSGTLRRLRFAWLGADGPSPLALHREDGLEDRPPIKWTRLVELQLGGVHSPQQTIRLATEFAPSLDKVRLLRSMCRGSLVDFADVGAWVEVELGQCNLSQEMWNDDASSIYSQGARASVFTDGGVSLTSREVPFILDLSSMRQG